MDLDAGLLGEFRQQITEQAGLLGRGGRSHGDESLLRQCAAGQRDQGKESDQNFPHACSFTLGALYRLMLRAQNDNIVT
jgi:hypothetical protein